jgi:hypothetical protein
MALILEAESMLMVLLGSPTKHVLPFACRDSALCLSGFACFCIVGASTCWIHPSHDKSGSYKGCPKARAVESFEKSLL